MIRPRGHSLRAWLAAMLVSACGRAEIVRPPRAAPAPAPGTPGTTPTASAATTAPPASPPAGPMLGTAHPVAITATAPDGQWLVACQARGDTNGDGSIAVTRGAHGRLLGDRLDQFFITESGDVPLDAWVAASPDGRHVVYVRGGRLRLVDTTLGSETDLTAAGADARDDLTPFRGHRAASFDAAGTRLLYLRREGTRTVAVLRELPTGTEHTIDPGPVDLWRAELGPAGRWVLLHVVGDDTNGNGRLDWPVPPAAGPRGCRGPVPSYPAWLDRGDDVVTKAARLDDGKVRLLPGFVTPLGPHAVVRKKSGALWLDLLPGEHRLTPPKCEARLLHVDGDRGLALATCTGEGARSPVLLVGKHVYETLPVDVAPVALDWPRAALTTSGGASGRLVPLYPGSDAALFDLDERKVHALETGDRVVAIHDMRALVRRRDHLVLFDATQGASRVLRGKLDEFADTLRAGSTVLVTPLVVDVGRGILLGRAPAGALAIRNDGHALVAAAPASADRLAKGGLRWIAPEPVPATE